ncbi:MAG: type IV pilus modification PilV family protein [Gaiellaceae bacterium]
MRARIAKEEGFGLLELTIAMVMLNVGILALIATFNSGALALRNAAATSNGTAVADKAMEVYRGLKNDAIYLEASDTGNDGSSGYPDGIPNSTSKWYATYKNDAAAFAGLSMFAYGGGAQAWVTDTTSFVPASYPPLPATATADVPSGLPTDPTQAVQPVTGPDGQKYPVLTYIVAAMPNAAGGWVKEVTIDVLNPRNAAQIIARESSLFDPQGSS